MSRSNSVPLPIFRQNSQLQGTRRRLRPPVPLIDEVMPMINGWLEAWAARISLPFAKNVSLFSPLREFLSTA
jgi:hypothetical protein